MSIGLKRNTVILEEHSAEWEVNAQQTIAVLKTILADTAVDIQHIGSTAVRGIMAKPIIDIAVGVNDFQAVSDENVELEKAGIIYRFSDVEGQLLYVMGDFEQDTRSHHIHIVKYNSDAWHNYLNFRDFLNTHPDKAKAYCELKQSLSQQYPTDRIRYTQEKQNLIDEILTLAKNKNQPIKERIQTDSMERKKQGLPYKGLDSRITDIQHQYQDKMTDYNRTYPSETDKRKKLIQEIFAEAGEHCVVETPVNANWGCHHVHLGDYIFINSNVTFVDDADIFIGDHSFIAPNVVFATASHPIYPTLRENGYVYCLPIHVGRNVWIGAGAVIMPGVTIGENSVIGAGSVVTKNIPSNVVAVGSPCKVLREINDHDKQYYHQNKRLDVWE